MQQRLLLLNNQMMVVMCGQHPLLVLWIQESLKQSSACLQTARE